MGVILNIQTTKTLLTDWNSLTQTVFPFSNFHLDINTDEIMTLRVQRSFCQCLAWSHPINIPAVCVDFIYIINSMQCVHNANCIFSSFKKVKQTYMTQPLLPAMALEKTVCVLKTRLISIHKMLDLKHIIQGIETVLQQCNPFTLQDS